VGRTWVQVMKPLPEQAITNFKEEQVAETEACETEDGPSFEMLKAGTEIPFPIIAERTIPWRKGNRAERIGRPYYGLRG